MKKLKSLRRIIAIMLAIAMALSTPGNSLFNKSRDVKAAGDWTPTSLVSNGDFESCSSDIADWDITNWLANDGLWYMDGSTDSYANNTTTVVKTNNSSDSASTLTMSQTISNVAAGTYKVSVRSTGSAGVVSGINVSISDGENTETKAFESVSSWGTWTTTETDAITLSETGSLTISIYGDVVAGYYGYIDDIVISKENSDSGNTDTHGTLLNGDFSTSGSGWIIDDSISDYAFYNTDGNATNNTTQHLKLNNYSGSEVEISISQEIENFAAGDYQLKFDISGDADTAFPLTAKVLDKNEQVLASSSSAKTTGWDAWPTVATGKFTVEEGADIKVVFEGTVPTSFWAYMDNVVIDPYVEPARSIAIDTNATVASPVDSDLYVEKVDLFDGFMTGFDISSYRSIKNSGATYKYADGTEIPSDEDFFALLKDSGVNYVRIRVWVNPNDENGKTYGGGCNDLEVAKDLGKLATDAGMKVLIDFHYSDFWTNPGKQNAPKEWKELDLTTKASTLKAYTKTSLQELLDAGVAVGMVQIGNETNDGFCGETNMTNMCTLFKSGSEAVQEIEETNSKQILIAIHVADPQSLNFSNYAKSLNDNGVVYDVFASSFYPYWHGTLDNLYTKLSAVATTYDKYVMVAETSYIHTIEDGDGHENTESESKLSKDEFPYPIGEQGQALHIRNVINTVASIKGSDGSQKGIGVFWWEPAWIPVQHYDADAADAADVLASNREIWETYGSGWATSAAADYDKNVGTWYGGSAVDNEGVFDFDGKALETLKIFNMVRGGTTADDYVVEVSDTSAEFEIGDEITLPDTVDVRFASGNDDVISVTWSDEELDAAKEEGIGEYQISGTVVYESETYNVVCNLTVTPVNLLINPSFEDALDGNWVLDDSGIARKNSSQDGNNNIRTGSYNLHFYLPSGGEHTFYQTLTLDKGIYRVGGHVSGESNSDDAQIVLYFTVGDDEYTAEGSMTGWGNWSNPDIKDIEITEDGTEVTIGIRATDFGAKAWGAYEDFYIYKTADFEEPEEPTPEEPTPEEPTPEEPTPEEPTPEEPETPVKTSTGTVSTDGILVIKDSPEIVAGLVNEKSDENDDVEFRWVACEENTPNAWFEISPWTKNNEWLVWTPSDAGNYIIVCQSRVVGNEEKSLVSESVGVVYSKHVIKDICQIPYEDGYLIGFESTQNPNQSYQYEMLVMDLTLFASGNPNCWILSTGRATVSEGNAIWITWKPEYGYYLTLFRVYDGEGHLLDQTCYGFANAY